VTPTRTDGDMPVSPNLSAVVIKFYFSGLLLWSTSFPGLCQPLWQKNQEKSSTGTRSHLTLAWWSIREHNAGSRSASPSVAPRGTRGTQTPQYPWVPEVP